MCCSARAASFPQARRSALRLFAQAAERAGGRPRLRRRSHADRQRRLGERARGLRPGQARRRDRIRSTRPPRADRAPVRGLQPARQSCPRRRRKPMAHNALRAGRRAVTDIHRLPAVPRPAEGRRSAHARRPARTSASGQVDHRRQPVGRRPCRRSRRHEVAAHHHRPRAQRACATRPFGTSPSAPTSSLKSIPTRKSESSRHCKTRPRRRLPRRRHQRRARAARRRRRHFGQPGSRRRQGGGRLRAARARPRRAAPGRRAGPQDLRQHTEIYLHHDQRQFRQHDQHGRGLADAAVPAAAGQADSAQQFPVGYSCDGDRQRQCRPRVDESPRRWDIGACAGSW